MYYVFSPIIFTEAKHATAACFVMNVLQAKNYAKCKGIKAPRGPPPKKECKNRGSQGSRYCARADCENPEGGKRNQHFGN